LGQLIQRDKKVQRTSYFQRLKDGMCAAAACSLLMMASSAASAADRDASNGQWVVGGQNLDNSRSQSETTIDKDNVGGLKTKWVFTTGGDVSATPAVANGIVYFPDWAGNFYAVNATTGAQIWQNKVSDWTGVAGDFARNDPLVHGGMVILGDQAGTIATFDGSKINGAGARVIAVNAQTGKLIWVSQVDEFPAAMVTGSPVVHDGVVYVGIASNEESLADNQGYPCCISRGSVVALDVQTGKKLWQTFPVPDNGGKVGGYSGGAIWSSTPVIDPKRNLIYVGTGNNYSVPDSVKACHTRNPNNKFCADASDHFESVLALDLKNGDIKWSSRVQDYDAWNVNCISAVPSGPVPGANCPVPTGLDYDFGGSGANLLTVRDGGTSQDILGIGEKSGTYWAFNPDDGSLIWNTQVGPGSTLGGIEWGTATDGTQIYVPISNRNGVPYALQPSETLVNGGSWAALDPTNGRFVWQTPTPGACSVATSGAAQGCMALGPVSVAGGVVFAGSMDINPINPTMFALDAHSGKILWSFVAGSSVNNGPAIVGNSVYWGSGYGHFGPATGTSNNKLFAFSVGNGDAQR
jgi:polyvinyl alcohol dehydrogenase (cytochrome)